MVNRLAWSFRAVACVLVGVFTFAVTPAHGGTLVAEAIAYTVGMVGTAVWAWGQFGRAAGRRYDEVATPPVWRIVLLTLVGVIGGLMSFAHNGGGLLAFSAIASLDAASEPAEWLGWFVAAAAVVAVELSALAFGGGSGSIVGAPLIVLVGLVSGRTRREYLIRATQSEQLVGQMEQLRAEQRQVATLAERSRIAREIHDVLAHSLGALSIQLQAAQAVLETGDVARSQQLLDDARRMTTDGLSETRRAIHALRGSSTDLDASLRELVTTHQGRHAAAVDYAMTGEVDSLGPDPSLALLRTAQEALVNAAKHEPGQPVHVVLSADDDRVELSVINELSAAAEPAALGAAAVRTPDRLVTANSGYGLAGLRERLEPLGGHLRAGPDGATWVVSASVPRTIATSG